MQRRRIEFFLYSSLFVCLYAYYLNKNIFRFFFYYFTKITSVFTI